jgi:type IV pilus assembly protein PilM
MEFLPRTSGARPRLACELRSEGIVAARSDEASDLLAAISRSNLGNAVLPLVRVGEVPGSHAFGTERPAVVAALRKAVEAVLQRSRDLTLIVPDGAARVLLLDFDALPTKPAEALSVVRFRLKKLVPFEVEHAAVSYQVMASSRDSIQVLAVAMPGDLIAEYESLVHDAGFEPGAVLPSTLAAIAGLREGDRPALVVNACHDGVTTAIVHGGMLLLHRTVDLSASASSSPEYDPSATAVAPTTPAETSISAIAARLAAGRTAVVSEPPAAPAGNASRTEITQAVSVAGAYFEDTLEAHPSVILSAGTLGAAALTGMLDSAGIRPVAVQELVDRNMLGVGASTGAAAIPLGWLAGVRGALAL